MSDTLIPGVPAEGTPAPTGTPEGAAPVTPTAPVEVPPATPTTPPAPPSPADMPKTQPPSNSAPTGDGTEGAPNDPAAELAKVRREAANYRTRLREQEVAAREALEAKQTHENEVTKLQELLKTINAVLNPDAEPETPDPAKLAEQLQQQQAAVNERDAKIRELTIRAALPALVSKAQADPQLTEAVLIANGALAKLDPAAPTFAADLESAIAEALDKNPRLKVAPVTTRSGPEIPGRSGGSDQLTREQLKGMSPEQIEAARQQGKLRALLGG